MLTVNKILYITDIHIRIKCLKELTELKQAINKATNVSLIIIGGDVLNNKYTNNDCYKEAEDLIRVCSRVAITYVLVGNHDYIDNTQFLTDKHWMIHLKNWPNVVIVDRVTTIMCGFQITCVPYVPIGRLVEALDSSGTLWKDSRLIFAHQEIKGARKGKTISSDGDHWDSTYPTLISGHIHDRQIVNKNVIYPGSTLNQGPQTHQQKIWFINTFVAQNGTFKFTMDASPFKTTMKRKIIVKTVEHLQHVYKNSKDLSNAIVIIDEHNAETIKEIKLSKAFKSVAALSHFICFAD